MKNYSLCKATTTVNDGSEPFFDYIIRDNKSQRVFGIPDLESFYNMDPALRQQKFNASVHLKGINGGYYDDLHRAVARLIRAYTPTTVNEHLDRLFVARGKTANSHRNMTPMAVMQGRLLDAVALCEQYPMSCFLTLTPGVSDVIATRSLAFSVLIDKHFTREEVLEARRAAPTETALVDRLAELLSDGLYAAVDRHKVKEGSANRVLVSA